MYYVATEKYTDENNHVELGGQMSYCLDTFISYADQYKKCMYIIDFFFKNREKDNAFNLCF